MVLNVHHRICMISDATMSRHNLHNIFQTLALIEDLVNYLVFQQLEITIETLYWEQNNQYCAAMAKVSHLDFWSRNSCNIWDIDLMIINSFQRGEKPCVILYVYIFPTLILY